MVHAETGWHLLSSNICTVLEIFEKFNMIQPNFFFWFILAILVAGYLLERFLEYLNSTYWSDLLPKELEGIYDAGKYSKSQAYEKDKQRFHFVVETLTLLVMVLIIITGGFAQLDRFIRVYTANPLLIALLFFGAIGLASGILSLPFDVYQVFVLEERYGFNRTSRQTFIFDKLKGLLLAMVLGGGLLSLVIFVYESTGPYFWFLTWMIISFFMIFISMFYSNLIVPLFNKQTPLEAGPLREAIEEFAAKTGFNLKNIFVIDGSKRSNKANAYFSGLGSKKRIVLYDTLIKDHTTEELVAVLAHEIGHYKKRHTVFSILLSIAQTGLMLFILSFFIQKNGVLTQSICQSLGGFSGLTVISGFHLGILAFGMIYSPLTLLIGMAMNAFSRKNEYAADRYAGVNFHPQPLMEALKKLSVNNLSNLRPHPTYVFFYYSHPPLLHRLSALDKIEKEPSGKN
jgi:STE24 endopeptidase